MFLNCCLINFASPRYFDVVTVKKLFLSPPCYCKAGKKSTTFSPAVLLSNKYNIICNTWDLHHKYMSIVYKHLRSNFKTNSKKLLILCKELCEEIDITVCFSGYKIESFSPLKVKLILPSNPVLSTQIHLY